MMNSLPILSLEQSPTEIAKQIHETFQSIGFIYIVDHGVDLQLCEQLEQLSKSFFKNTREFKKNFAMQHAGKAWRGYFSVGEEFTAGKIDFKEGLYFGVEHANNSIGVKKSWPMHGKNIWPDPSWMQPIQLYMHQLEKLAYRLLDHIGNGLGLPEGYFRKFYTEEPTQLFRIFNYPRRQDKSEFGVGEHTDMGFLTILYQDASGGLEVNNQAGEWLTVPPIKGSFVVNIGDMLEYFTRGIYRATLHRVRNHTSPNRLSMPYFFDPHWQACLQPISENLLRESDLAARNQSIQQRWDGLDLHLLDKDSTYGDFVWNKIKDVFPHLCDSK